MIDYLQDGAEFLEWPMNTPHPSCVGESPTWLVPVILSTVFIGGALCLWCCICWLMRRKRHNRAKLWPKIGASWERLQTDGESMPLTDIQPAHMERILLIRTVNKRTKLSHLMRKNRLLTMKRWLWVMRILIQMLEC